MKTDGKKETPGSPQTQTMLPASIWQVFPSIWLPKYPETTTAVSKRHSYSWSWPQSLASSVWFWYSHVESKNCSERHPPRFQRRAWQTGNVIRALIPGGKCWKEIEWSWRCSGIARRLEMPEKWTVCQGNPWTTDRASCRDRVTWPAVSKAIEAGYLSSTSILNWGYLTTSLYIWNAKLLHFDCTGTPC